MTTDNPRGADPEQIISEIEPGMSGAVYEKIADREEAIRAAVAEARGGDVVLIAGKGHEDYQEVGGVRRPFSDVAIARAALRGRVA